MYIESDAAQNGPHSVFLQPDYCIAEDSQDSEVPTNLRPVAYAIKYFSTYEQHYANINWKLCSVVFSVETFKHFIFSHKCSEISDHKLHTSLVAKNVINISQG